MTFAQNLKLQKAVRCYFTIDHWNAPHAVTLTLKQQLMSYNGIYPESVPLTPERASQNLNHNINVINKKIYGNAPRRDKALNDKQRLLGNPAQGGKMGVPVIPILEGGGVNRLHYHLIIDCPRDDLLASFPELIAKTWRASHWGYNEIKIVSTPDQGWITYMTKLRDKPDFAEAIDWLNYYNP